MKVVCNATPLIHLSAIDQLDLLRDLFGEIAIPQAVYAEVVGQGAGKPGAAEVKAAKWIKKHRTSNRQVVQALETILGKGEAACIALAMSLKADLVVLDDRKGRIHAKAQGLRITGTVGILLTAAERGSVDFEQALDKLLATGFRMSPREYEHIIDLWRKGKGT